MVVEEVLLLPKRCSTRKAPRRSDGLSPRGTCTTPDSLSPADGKVTACSVIGKASVFVLRRLRRASRHPTCSGRGFFPHPRVFPCPFRFSHPQFAPAGVRPGNV